MRKRASSQDPPQIVTLKPLDTHALVKKRRAAMRRRTRKIRKLVALAATTTFLGASGLIGVQLASGHDPALVADAKKKSRRDKRGQNGRRKHKSGRQQSQIIHSGDQKIGRVHVRRNRRSHDNRKSDDQRKFDWRRYYLTVLVRRDVCWWLTAKGVLD